MCAQQEAFCPCGATVLCAPGVWPWCMITAVTTHFPDQGARQTPQQPPVGPLPVGPLPLETLETSNRSQKKTRNSLCSRSYDYAMTASGKRHWYLCFFSFLLLKNSSDVWSRHVLPVTSLKQPHHRLKEMNPLSSSRGLLTIPIYFLNT